MPKRTLYLKDEEDALYERVKGMVETSGGTISGIFVNALKAYVETNEAETAGMPEHILFDGVENCMHGDSTGEHIRFFGRLIGTGTNTDPQDNSEYTQTLYRTRKKQYLLHTTWQVDEYYYSRNRVIKDNEELRSVNLASEIISKLAEDKGVVRFLDI